MNSERRSRTCCGLFDIKTGSSMILASDLTLMILGVISDFLSREERVTFAERGFFFVLSMIAIISNFVGLISINRRKPDWMIPCLICKTLAFIGIVFLGVHLITFLIYFNELELVMLIILYAVWYLYSTVVLYLCYKEVKEDLSIDGPAGTPPYNSFVNQPV